MISSEQLGVALCQLKTELKSQAEGYLKIVKRLGTRRRYFRLSGTVLYEYVTGVRKEQQEPREVVVSRIYGTNDAKLEITLAVADKKKPITVIAYTPEEFKSWKGALFDAVQRDIFNQYRIGRQLGRGSFGDVYYGEEKRTGMQVAIKRIEKRENSRFLEREINVAKSVNHPGVVKTFDIFETSEHLYLVLEYMSGGELYDVLAERRTLSEVVASQVTRSILQALAYLHRNGIVHRDLKPENILCKSMDYSKLDVKIADFGLAGLMIAAKHQRYLEEEEEPSTLENIAKKSIAGRLGSLLSKKLPGSNSVELETRGKEHLNWLDYDLYAAAENELMGTDQTMSSFVGSPAFCAPEVLRKQKYGPPVDSWGMGCILFNILCGKLPFEGATARETVKLVKEAKYEMMEEDWMGISEGAKSLVKGLLQEDPLKRLSAEAALHHPWLAADGKTLSNNPLRHDISLLHSRRRAVKRTLRGVKATARMKALSEHFAPNDFTGGSSARRSMSLSDKHLLSQITKHLQAQGSVDK